MQHVYTATWPPAGHSGQRVLQHHMRLLQLVWKGHDWCVWLQVGKILKEALLQHMLRFRYSDFGALQLKRDMSEYQATAAMFGLPRVNELFEHGMQLANTLIVPPSSLLEVVESGLQMDRATARKYISLREDYATARVGGKPLSVIMGEPAGALGGFRPSAVGSAVTPPHLAARGAAEAMRSWMGGGS
jgi:hypothetical protein